MKRRLKFKSIFVLAPILAPLIILGACGDSDKRRQLEQKRHQLLQTQLDALEKAKQVEGMVKDQAAQRRRQIDEIESQK